MRHLGTKTLETERLILRRFRPEDAGSMFNNWASDPEVTKYLKWPPHKDTEETGGILSSWIPGYANDDHYIWAIVLKENGDFPIGCISVVGKNDKIGMLSIGYCIGRAWWNKGITSEALRRVVEYLITEVGAGRVEARHDPKNPNSGKVMLKCGLKYEGTLRQADWNNQGICDSAVYAVLAEDYEA